jgi:hypothetical protein
MPCLAERVCTIKPLVCNEGRHRDIHLTAVLTHVLPYAFCGVMRLVDLFAGLGGFSAGAIEAGAEEPARSFTFSALTQTPFH